MWKLVRRDGAVAEGGNKKLGQNTANLHFKAHSPLIEAKSGKVAFIYIYLYLLVRSVARQKKSCKKVPSLLTTNQKNHSLFCVLLIVFFLVRKPLSKWKMDIKSMLMMIFTLTLLSVITSTLGAAFYQSKCKTQHNKTTLVKNKPVEKQLRLFFILFIYFFYNI